jgi:acylphosphatase
VKQSRRNTEDGRVHAIIYGTVQGVGFRYHVRQAARRLGLAGYVLNRPDGAVEFEAAGDPMAVAELLRTVEHGPGHVERVEIVEYGLEALPEPFTIR